MRKQSASAVAGAAVSLALLAVPARAQNFQDGSTDTIRSGNFRLMGSPVHMFGPDGRPDRTGGAFRLGYGITDSFDVEAKTGFFDGFDLVGGDGHYRLFNGETSLSVRAGGHEAIVRDGPNSTALDLSAQVGQHLKRRLEIYAGPAFSWESVNGVPNAGFTRWYVVPGVKWGLAERLELMVEGGVGLNDSSPSYVTAGLALYMPVSGGAQGRRH